jgi:acetyl-CoA carboxylase beta subunit
VASDVIAAPARKADEPVQWLKCPSCDAFIYSKRLVRTSRSAPSATTTSGWGWTNASPTCWTRG